MAKGRGNIACMLKVRPPLTVGEFMELLSKQNKKATLEFCISDRGKIVFYHNPCLLGEVFVGERKRGIIMFTLGKKSKEF